MITTKMRTIDELKNITPSELLRDSIQKSGKSLATIGRTLEVKKQYISSIVNGHRPISAQTAYELERSVGSAFLNGEELYLCQCLNLYEKIVNFNQKEELCQG
jgi:transcriptional regulator with XRE-family HTH domain